MRNLDIGALRSLIAIADTQGVTKAAQRVNLTQSAVSMQIKRLEEALDTPLLHRCGRGVVLSSAGEQLVSYGRRIIALNDETWTRLTNHDFEGELVFGVPFDLVYPHVPTILKQMTAAYPRVRISVVSSLTRLLKEQFGRGEVDLILTTEEQLNKGGETLLEPELNWIGAINGKAYLRRPLPVALQRDCALKPRMIEALDQADIAWETIADVSSETATNAVISADLGVAINLGAQLAPGCEVLAPRKLPTLGTFLVNMYASSERNPALAEKLVTIVRRAYGAGRDGAARGNVPSLGQVANINC